MNPPNSSTFSSKPGELRRAIKLVGWIALGLFLIDLAANIAFAYPSDPKNMGPGRLAMYFEYGRSTEGRLRGMTRADPAQTAPITLAGWYRPLIDVKRATKPGADQVTIYGMSHAVRLADALHRVSPFAVRSVGAPGATTNWSYGAFLRDEGNRDSKVVVLSIMSSTLPSITTLSPMTWNSTQPIPYTQDRFVVRDGQLMAIRPPYESFPDYVATFNDPVRWKAATEIFRANDTRYDAFLMRENATDNSSIIRLLRRAYRQKLDRDNRGKVLDARGFDADSEQLIVANAIVKDFAQRARSKGQMPIVYVVNNFGYGDQLSRALSNTLDSGCIPALLSDKFVSPFDPRNYLPDSHFTDEQDEVLAKELGKMIEAQMTSSQGNATSVACKERSKSRIS